jgi:hypothetical protein
MSKSAVRRRKLHRADAKHRKVKHIKTVARPAALVARTPGEAMRHYAERGEVYATQDVLFYAGLLDPPR